MAPLWFLVGSIVLVSSLVGKLLSKDWEDRMLLFARKTFPFAARYVSIRRAHLAEARGDIAKAIGIFEEVGAPSSERGFYFFELGELNRKFGNLREAQSCFEKALLQRGEFSVEFTAFIGNKLDEVKLRLKSH
jgi:tetratricopeptide (TPR) repeat protein